MAALESQVAELPNPISLVGLLETRKRSPGSSDPVEACAVGFDPRGRCLVAEATAITDEERAFRIRMWDLHAGKPVFAAEAAAAQSRKHERRKHEKEKKEQSPPTTLFRVFVFRAFVILLNLSASLR